MLGVGDCWFVLVVELGFQWTAAIVRHTLGQHSPQEVLRLLSAALGFISEA